MTLKFGMLQTADKYQLKITNQKGRCKWQILFTTITHQ